MHGVLLVVSLVTAGISLWKVGWVPEGKNHPNLTLVAMFFLAAGQVIGIVSHRKEQKKENP